MTLKYYHNGSQKSISSLYIKITYRRYHRFRPIGDEVLAYNEETGEVDSYTVTAVHIHTDEEIA